MTLWSVVVATMTIFWPRVRSRAAARSAPSSKAAVVAISYLLLPDVFILLRALVETCDLVGLGGSLGSADVAGRLELGQVLVVLAARDDVDLEEHA